MSIQPFSQDVAVIQKLDDEPNDVTGLTPAELKLRFDQAAIWLKDYINNTLIPALSATSGGGTGASNIGASVPNFTGSTVQAVLNAFNDALVDRYTKAQTNSYVSQETNALVASVSVDTATGVITVAKKDGSKQTFDTALEKVPATMALLEESGGTWLVITNQDGSKTKTDVSKLIDQYMFNDSPELDFSTGKFGDTVTVTASIRPSSIGLNRFAPEVTEALEQYNATSKGYADEAIRQANSATTASNFANDAALRAQDSVSQAQYSASNAAASAAQASQSAAAAAVSASSAQSNATQALQAKNAAQDARAEAERWAKEAENAAGGGVISFNGRTGAVTPQSGDYTAAMVGAIPSAEKGKANGVAELDSSGKVPSAQLPAMNYDPAGSAQAVQEALTTHVDDTENPHNVTASQAGAFSKEDTLQTSTAELFGLSGSATPNDVLQKLSEAAFNANGSITDVNGDAIGVQIATGSYSGTGSIQKISLTFKPKFLFIVLVDRTNTSAEPVLSFSTPNAGRYQAYSSSASPINITFEKDGFTLQTKMNEIGYTYDYTAIG